MFVKYVQYSDMRRQRRALEAQMVVARLASSSPWPSLPQRAHRAHNERSLAARSLLQTGFFSFCFCFCFGCCYRDNCSLALLSWC